MIHNLTSRMATETLVELQDEKNVVLKEINEVLTQIHEELKNLNKITASGSEFSADFKKVKDQITIMKTKISPKDQAEISRRLSQKNKSQSVQIVQGQDTTSFQVLQETIKTTD